MIIYKKELKQGQTTWLTWTSIMCIFLGIVILIYPEMKNQMNSVGDAFSNMGEFSTVFGLDQLNMGEFKGYFGVECGNILGMFGTFYAALLGISSLAKEEKEHTAEFLLTHPITRAHIVLEKLLAIITQITLTNICIVLCSLALISIIIKDVDSTEFLLMFFAYYLMQLEISMITFAISSFLSKGDLGIGLGIAATSYFLGIFAKLMEKLEPIKYITPFGYADSAHILTEGEIHPVFLTSGILISIASIILVFSHYHMKEIS